MAPNSNRTKNRRRRRAIITQPRQLGDTVNFNDDDDDKQSETDDLSEVFSKLPAKTEILSEIFSRLPPQAIFKFRCVSKSLSNLTQQENFIRKYSSTFKPLIRWAITGLYFQQRCWLDYACLPCTPAFVLVDSESGRFPDPSLDYLAQKGGRMEAIEVFDSCNGLLLCRRNTLESYGVSFTFFVTNPLTMEKIVLPPLRWDRVEHALLAELTSSGCLRYKVLCLFRSKHGNPCSKLSIFSSEIGEWERCEERLPPVCEKVLMGSKVFFKGRLFWDCLEGYILICHLNVKRGCRCYELIEAPRAPLGRCLWVFEDELRCYCHGFPNEFPAWSLCVNNNETRKLKWKLEGFEEFETLSQDVSRIAEKWVITRKVMPRILFKIVAYHSSSKKLFLFVPDSIYSYKLTKRKLKMLWTGAYDTWKFNSPSCAFPYVHSLAHIETRLIASKEKEMDDDNVKENKDLIGSDLIQRHSFEELVSLYENSANMVKPCRKAPKAQKGPFLA